MSGTSKSVISICVLLLAALVVYYGMTPPEVSNAHIVDLPVQRPALFGGDPEEKLISLGFPPLATELSEKSAKPVTIQNPTTFEPDIEVEIETIESTLQQVEIVEQTYEIYTVKEGETLSDIASDKLGSYRMWRELASINNISDPTQIRPGRVLRMPSKKSAKSSTVAQPTEPLSDDVIIHVVIHGDTLSSIAGMHYKDINKYGVIARANPSLDPSHLKIGTRVIVPKIETQIRVHSSISN